MVCLSQILSAPGSGREVHTVLASTKLPEITPTMSPQHIAEPLLLSPKKSETKLALPPKIHRTTKDDLSVGLCFTILIIMMIIIFV